MKNTLGKIILIILLQISAMASLASYKLTADRYELYTKEAVEIIFSVKQENHDDVMFFFLEPKKSDRYKIVLLQKEIKELAYHDKKTIFRYLLFPLKSGSLNIDFDLTIKVASDEAVAQVYRGSRDNVKWIETRDTKVKLKPLILNVKGLDEDVDLIGDFKIVSKLKNNTIDAYENVNITYLLEGIGYDNINIEPINKIKNVQLFKETTEYYHKATKDGYKIKKEFNYALVSDKSFSIKEKNIRCFSPRKSEYYTIKLQEQKITVNTIDKSTLIDTQDYPSEGNSFENIQEYLIYFIIFITGFLTAKIAPKNLKLPLEKNSYNDIKSSKTPKELLYILMHSYSKYDLKNENDKLEKIVYTKENSRNFKSIKRDVLKIISNP